MTITLAPDYFLAALKLIAPPDVLAYATEHLPSWCGAWDGLRDDSGIILWIAGDVPTAEQLQAWREELEATVGNEEGVVATKTTISRCCPAHATMDPAGTLSPSTAPNGPTSR